MTSRQTETVLRASPLVQDCRLVDLPTAAGGRRPVLYVVPAPRVGSDDVRALALSCGLAPDIGLVLMPGLPLDDEGDWDVSLLASLAVLDEPTRDAAERLAGEALGGAAVAAVGDTGVAPSPPWHLSALRPWARPPFSQQPLARAITIAGNAPDDRPLALSDGGPLHVPADAPCLLADLLHRAARAAAPAGLVLVEDDGGETELSYAELLARAEAVLGGLQAAGLKRGDPLVFQLRRHADFLTAFWACVLGGIVPVPVAVPATFGDANAALRRVADALDLFDEPVLIGDAATLDGLAHGAAFVAQKPHRRLDIAALAPAPAALDGAARPEDIALMMLTSGSTGRPKGVPHPHRTLLARTFGSQQQQAWPVGLVSLNWMPLDHVAGLIYFHLRDVFLAARQVHVPTELILKAPLRWMDLLQRHRVQVTFAPNFAFGLVDGLADDIARRRWDLSNVQRILNGGEAIVAAPSRRFLQLLAPHGLRPDAMMPAWGMSEVSSGVTYDPGFRLETTADSDSWVRVGRPIPGVQLRVVGEADELLREGEVGQLQLAGRTLFGGYHGSGPTRSDSFTADGWFRTGDLARLDDGFLTITGRDKDVIIINGVNFAGAAIESAVEELAGVARSFTAACAVADPRADGGEGLALFIVPDRGDDARLAELLRAIRQRVVQAFGISPVVIVPLARDDVPKTSIGKIQRAALQKALREGQFESVLRRVDVLEANEHTLPRWFFERRWQRCNRPDGPPSASPLLLLGPRHDPLVQALLMLEPDAILAEPGARFERRGPRHFQRDTASADEAAPLMAALAAEGLRPGRTLWLWPSCSAATLVERCREVVLALARSGSGWSTPQHPSSVALVTRGGAAVRPQEQARPELAQLGALVQTVAQERPQGRLMVVDLDATDDPAVLMQQARSLLDELAGPANEPEVAWRGGQRWVPRLAALRTPAVAATVLRRGGRYVVTGGLGGIGLALAEWLLREFDADVLLLSRRSLQGAEASSVDGRAAAAAWMRLRSLSPRIAHGVADVADATALRAAMQPAIERWGAEPDAVFHLAGAYHETALADEDASGVEQTLRAKVGGLEALLRVRAPATAIACFSSVSSLFGGALVGAYAAANRALDALARQPGVWTLNWSGWHDTGLSRRYGASEPLRAMGVLDLPPRQALDSLRVALAQPAGQWAIGLAAEAPFVAARSTGWRLEQSLTVFCEAPAALPTEVPALDDRFGHRCPLRLRAIQVLPRDADGAPDRATLARIARHGSAFRAAGNPTEMRLTALWREVLRLQAVSSDASFFELGGQSLLASRLASAISTAFGVQWALRDVFEAPTIAAQAMRLGATASASADPLTRADLGRPLPLSSAQQRLWFLQQMHPHSAAFHIPASIHFAHRPDPARVRQALQAVVDRHASLRTRFPCVDGQAHQVVDAARAVDLQEDTLQPADTLQAVAEAQAREPFDLAAGPLLRARLLHLPEDAAVLLLTLHHIVADGWSMKQFFADWLAAYRGQPLPPLPAQYPDFAAWQQQRAGSAAHEAQAAHWRLQLGDQLTGMTLPTDRPRPSLQSHEGQVLHRPLPPALARRLRQLAQAQGVTLFMLLLAAYKALLARRTGQPDVIVGTVWSNRTRSEFDGLIGFVVNVLVLRTEMAGHLPFADALQRVRSTVLAAQAHGELPFETLVDRLQPPRDGSRSPLFQLAFDLRDRDILRCDEPGLRFGVMEPDLGAAQYDLHLTLEESLDDEPALTALWQFNTDLFDARTVDHLADQYQALLEAAADAPHTRLDALRLASPARQAAILARWCGSPRPLPGSHDCLHRLVRAAAQRTPDALALLAPDGRVSHGELDALSDRVAQALHARGIGRGAIVAVCAPRSAALIAATLGILKAGAAYLPLDPAYPADRLGHMLADSGAALLLLADAVAAAMPPSGPQRLRLEDALQAPARPLADGTEPGDLAYVIYTSGSTGLPKGVMIEHRSACNLAIAQAPMLGIGPGKRVLQFAAFGFDASVWEIFSTLAHGATLVLPSAADAMPGMPLLGTLHEHRVNIATLPPPVLRALPEAPLPLLDTLVSAGEACDADIVRRWGSTRRLINAYGPTEGTVCATWGVCDAASDKSPSIGRPVAGLAVYLLDGELQPVPEGVVGELFIGGTGVARGYLGREVLTRERFVPDPHAGTPGARMYRTGDRARYRADGQIDYLGRSDEQLKLRGYRIELGEIEAVLRLHPAVADAVVSARRDATGDTRLVAHVVARGAAGDASQALSAAGIRQHLSRSLPDWMLPGDVVLIDALPLTPNGKMDRKRLPAPPVRTAATADAAALPASSTARQLAAIWQEVLDLPQVGLHDNFFDLGGQSLKMARVHGLLGQRLARADIPLVSLFQHPTIASLAAHLDAGPAAPGAADAEPGRQRVEQGRDRLRQMAARRAAGRPA